MKEKNLFVCETPFQVLASILLIYSSEMNSINDFIIVDTMRDYSRITERLSKYNFVNYVYAASTKVMVKGNGLSGVINRCFPKFSSLWPYKKMQEIYDHLYCRNYTTPITEVAFRHFKRNNPKLDIHIIDEGYSSYMSDFWNSHNSISFFHKFSNIILSGHRDFTYRNITKAFFFDQDLLHIKLPFTVKNLIKKNFKFNMEQLQTINTVFGYNSSNDIFDNKFIFFEECFSFDDGNNSDLEIVDMISQVVGKDNLIIKLHPRSQKDRFSPLGYKVMNLANYPWEVYALNNYEKKIILLAYSSGALMNYLFFTRSNMKSVLLYKLFPGKYAHMMNDEIKLWFDEFQKKYHKWIYTPESQQSLVKILSKEVSAI